MLSEDEGVKAIQFLLSVSGESESEDISRKNWNTMTDHEKQQTEMIYKIMIRN